MVSRRELERRIELLEEAVAYLGAPEEARREIMPPSFLISNSYRKRWSRDRWTKGVPR